MEYQLQVESPEAAGRAAQIKLEIVRKEENNPNLQIVMTSILPNTSQKQVMLPNGDIGVATQPEPGYTMKIVIE